MSNVADPVQRQLDAYNAHDLERFVAEYADDIQVVAVYRVVEDRIRAVWFF